MKQNLCISTLLWSTRLWQVIKFVSLYFHRTNKSDLKKKNLTKKTPKHNTKSLKTKEMKQHISQGCKLSAQSALSQLLNTFKCHKWSKQSNALRIFPNPKTQITENFIDQNPHSELHSEMSWELQNIIENTVPGCKCETKFYTEVSFLWCRLGKQRDESMADTLAAVQKAAEICMVGIQ